jgi:tetratricopeptide (TPR) repeat protein
MITDPPDPDPIWTLRQLKQAEFFRLVLTAPTDEERDALLARTQEVADETERLLAATPPAAPDQRTQLAMRWEELGWLLQERGELKRAFHNFARTMGVRMKLHHAAEAARLRGVLGGVRRAQGQRDEAVALYQRAAAEYERLGMETEAASALQAVDDLRCEAGGGSVAPA